MLSSESASREGSLTALNTGNALYEKKRASLKSNQNSWRKCTLPSKQ